MKVVIALACLMALAAALDETDAVVEASDLDVAEYHRRGGYYGGYRHGYAGYGGGYRGGYGGYGWGRKRRSVEEEALASDLEAAEHHRRGYGGYGSRGGYGYGGYRGGYGGYGGFGGYGGHRGFGFYG
ncbi:shematrin-like protein 2 [Daphnia magna]|uniref:Uncharacterized protein n=1 Tax=Daphnia magna TaxID=35525 RepID=A0A0P6F738_9CRUS|nr:shematrin-like protein 2 [Daphnia magna]KAK4020961.1 hypothetical protein OUZ56_002898 [Daphnia magna]